MLRVPVIAVSVALLALVPAYGQDKEAWCTDAHMKQMDADIAKMTGRQDAKVRADAS